MPSIFPYRQQEFLRRLLAAGLDASDDPRFTEMYKRLTDAPQQLDMRNFASCVSSEILLISEALSGELVIPVPFFEHHILHVYF